MEKNFVILIGICIISGACCFPSGENGKSAAEALGGVTSTVDIKSPIVSTASTISSIVSDVVAANGSVTVTPVPKSSGSSEPNTTTVTPPTTTNTTTPTTPLTTSPTTLPTTTTPATTTTIPTTPSTTTTTVKPTTTTSPATTSVSPPSTTATPTPAPSHDRHFDGPSFIGGMLISLASVAVIFVIIKVYRARTERNYHTL